MSDIVTTEQEPPVWASGLLPEQKSAASHDGGNARLLAGPGTGKTLTLKARVEFLVLERKWMRKR